MANFGVYFNITNNTGTTLGFMRADLDHASYDGPTAIPSQPQPTSIHLNDPDFMAGASGTIYFVGAIGGQMRQYAWYGSCPVRGDNQAAGPGITTWTGPNGHPLTINIYIDEKTPGWTPFPPKADEGSTKAMIAKLSGKKPADPENVVKFG